MYKIGSLFSGIGGFELGLERAIPAETIWQVEQDKFCQSILKKHWPKAKIFNDVRNITKDNVDPVDILCGGFPCQDISIAGKTRGLKGEKSALWWEMWRIISELRPRFIVLENVANIIRLGGREVVGSLAQIGYNAEWTTIKASDFGAPHRRERWFCIAYPSHKYFNRESISPFKMEEIQQRKTSTWAIDSKLCRSEKERYWERHLHPSPFCRMDDGISNRVARLKALGNAIVPQCSQWIGEQIWNSGILQGCENV
jgi:DNA (cytosine-5)-methyltransferase 1